MPFVQELACEDKRFEFRKWHELKCVIDTLSIPYVPSIKLQAVQCTLTDMWGLWTLLLLQLEKDNSALAKNILKSLKRRVHVIKNPTMYAALFLDPRYKSVLRPVEQQIAMCELVNLHDKLQNKQSQNQIIEREIDELELMLMATDMNADDVTEEDFVGGDSSSIQREFELFKRIKRVEKENSVLAFWKENKIKFPQMYRLARVLFSVSNGQTSVERAFSALNYVYNDRRCNLNADILNDILMIRLNKEIFFELDNNDWDVIIKKQQVE